MQIQHSQAVQSTATQSTSSSAAPANTVESANKVASSNVNETLPVEKGVQVSISSQAQQLAKADQAASKGPQIQPMPAPDAPEKHLSGEQLDKAVQIKKAQIHYNVTSDMANIVNSGSNDDGLSMAGAYYLAKNEDAREVAVSAKTQQQNMQNMQAYQQQTEALNEQYS